MDESRHTYKCDMTDSRACGMTRGARGKTRVGIMCSLSICDVEHEGSMKCATRNCEDVMCNTSLRDVRCGAFVDVMCNTRVDVM